MNNIGVGGGALAIYSTPLYIDNAANISFINNCTVVDGKWTGEAGYQGIHNL